jgi:hypothetical protein
MKNIASPIIGVIIPYLILITSWERDVQIIAISTFWLILLYFSIIRAGGLNKFSSYNKILIAPFHILLAFALLNFILDLKANVLVVWAGFIVLTFASYIVAAFFSKE